MHIVLVMVVGVKYCIGSTLREFLWNATARLGPTSQRKSTLQLIPPPGLNRRGRRWNLHLHFAGVGTQAGRLANRAGRAQRWNENSGREHAVPGPPLTHILSSMKVLSILPGNKNNSSCGQKNFLL